MAVRNKGGHGVSSTALPHNQQAQAAQPAFPDTQGPAAHGALKKKVTKYPPAK